MDLRALLPTTTLFMAACLLPGIATQAQIHHAPQPATAVNYALHLDGNDNNPCIGMDILKDAWTLEAWIKGNDNNWKKTEAIIGAGEYGDISIVDQLPLVLKNGCLQSTRAGISTLAPLDSNWHHVAATCNGTTTKLFLDGKEVAAVKKATAILPGAIGTNDADSSTFGGLIDEVRIWSAALPPAVLQQWIGKPITRSHPAFKQLKGYYTFDDMQDDVSLNLAGKNHQAYHMRNTRKNYKGTLPLAYLVENHNPAFSIRTKKQTLFNAVTIQSEWDASQGAPEDQVLKLRIVVNGTDAPLQLTALQLDLSQTSRLNDLSALHVYYAGQSPRAADRITLSTAGITPARQLQIKPSAGNIITLKNGANYFLVTADVKPNALPGDTVHITVPSFSLNGVAYTPEDHTGNIRKTIIAGAATNSNTIRLLQWNIWHGGVHAGNNGRNRILELIRHTQADIVTMQEAYGYQQMLADSLGFQLSTAAPGDNLALFSRYPMEKHLSSDKFKSNTATITLPNKKRVLVADWWLRYAYKHEYTDYYPVPGSNTNDWIAEDLQLSTADAAANLTRDVAPLLTNDTLPVIVAGDFNSGSHLDWTTRTAHLHYGYGGVALPTSRFMLDKGFRDSFREQHPNELTHQGGTFAVIYGHLQTCRIDYIYYKGQGIQATASKIIRTAPEIDDVWPSDHAAVLTVFHIR